MRASLAVLYLDFTGCPKAELSDPPIGNGRFELLDDSETFGDRERIGCYCEGDSAEQKNYRAQLFSDTLNSITREMWDARPWEQEKIDGADRQTPAAEI